MAESSEVDRIFVRSNGRDDVLRYTAPLDMSSSPTITLPGGASAAGMPIGFQLVAGAREEPLLVRAGRVSARDRLTRAAPSAVAPTRDRTTMEKPSTGLGGIVTGVQSAAGDRSASADRPATGDRALPDTRPGTADRVVTGDRSVARQRTATRDPTGTRDRPITRDPEATRDAILSAATEEFAQHGLGGARVDRIAERADINKRMLYYYFGHKDALFLAVLERAYEGIRSEERQLNLTRVEPTEAIRRLISFTWNYYIEHPEFLSLLNSENLHRARYLKQSAHVKTLHSPFVATIAEVLERGRKLGVFRADVDPVQLYISIAGLSYFYLGNNYTLSTIFDRDLLSPKARLERLSHMTDLVLGYLVRD